MDLTELVSSFVVPAWVVVLIGICTALYIYLTWNFGYWEKQGIKCDKPWPLLGNFNLSLNIIFDEIDTKNYKKHGRIYGVYEGRRPALMVADPEVLKTVLVKEFNVFRNRRFFEIQDDVFSNFVSAMRDDDWKELRNIITPTFTTGKMKQMVSLMEECGNSLIKHLRKYEEQNIYFDARECISSFTMDVIATCAFGTKIDSLEDPKSDFVKHAKKMFALPSKLFILLLLLPKLAKYFSFIPTDSVNYFKNLLNKVISARNKENNLRKDFLQLLIEAKTESEKENNVGAMGNIQEDKEKSKFVMTHNHIIAQAILFLVAGFETTGITLSFILYNLVLNEDIQDKLINEIDNILTKYKGVISYEALSEMQYLEMVISETLRLYPPATRAERECQEDNYNLHGIVLKKGCTITIPIYCLHHDKEYFPNPEIFDPERFSPENRAKMNPYTYMPFGYGLRNCIGMRFALMEMKVALISILKTFRVKKCEETQIPFKRSNRISFLQPENMNIKLELRTNGYKDLN